MLLLPYITSVQNPYIRLLNFDIGALFGTSFMTRPDRHCSYWKFVIGCPRLKLTFVVPHAISFCIQYSRQLRLWQMPEGGLWD